MSTAQPELVVVVAGAAAAPLIKRPNDIESPAN